MTWLCVVVCEEEVNYFRDACAIMNHLLNQFIIKN